MNTRRILSQTALITGTLLFSAGIQTFAAFTQPTTSPPNSDTYAPISTGPTAQSKSGGLLLNTGGATNGLIVQAGNVGIGTTAPGKKLTVAGGAIAVDATQAIYFDGGSNTYIYEATGDRLDIVAGATSVAQFSNTGITFTQDITVSSGDITLAEGGTVGYGNAKWTFDSANSDISTTGNVGIGTTNPTQKLQIVSANPTVANPLLLTLGKSEKERLSLKYNNENGVDRGFIYAYDSNYYGDSLLAYKDLVLGVGDSEELAAGRGMIIKPTGNVGIGTTNPTQKLQIVSANPTVANPLLLTLGKSEKERLSLKYMNENGVDRGFIYAYDSNYGAYKDLVLGVGDSNELAAGRGMIIKPTGNVGIGTTNPSTNTLQVTGSAGKTVGGTSWQDLSDIRLKNILGELNGTSLETLMKLRPVKYEWNDLHKQLYDPDGKSTDTVMYGFVAQELKDIIPQMVSVGGDGYYWYNPSGFEAILTAGVQELYKSIQEIIARVVGLEERLNAQEKTINELTERLNRAGL